MNQDKVQRTKKTIKGGTRESVFRGVCTSYTATARLLEEGKGGGVQSGCSLLKDLWRVHVGDGVTNKGSSWSGIPFIYTHVVSQDRQIAGFGCLDVELFEYLLVIGSVELSVFLHVDVNGDKHSTIGINDIKIPPLGCFSGLDRLDKRILSSQVLVSHLDDPMDPSLNTTQLMDRIVYKQL